MPKRFLCFLILSLSLFLNLVYRNALADEAYSWQDCIKEAAKNHPDLIAAGEGVKQSEAAKRVTASTLFPQINSNLDASRARTDSGTSSATNDSYQLGVSGTQLIFDGLKTINNINAAKENIKSSLASYRFTSTEVRFRLRTAFVDLLRAQELVQVAEEILKIRRSNLELITLRYQSGLEHRGALLKAEANLAEANFEVAQAKRDVELAQRQLTKEMGRKEFIFIKVKADFAVSDLAREKPDFEALAKNNPSLQQIISQKNAADFSLRSAYANFSPTLSGEANANKSGSQWSPRNDQWNMGLTLSMPIFEGGLRLAQVAQARALFNQLQANERSTKDAVIINLAEAWVSLQDAVETVEVQYKTLVAAQERSKIAEAQYSVGFITYDNWTIIEDDLVRAKRSFLDSQANALLAEAGWVQAKGERLEYAQ